MAIGETRRANLRWLIDTEFEGVDARLAKRVGLHPSQISRALSVSSGAALGNRLARRIEAKAGKPEGWMDEVHLFSEEFSQKLRSAKGKAIVVSPLTTYQFLTTSWKTGKGMPFCRHLIRRRSPRLNHDTKLR